MKVIKRNGSEQEFNKDKIKNAICKAFNEIEEETITDIELDKLVNEIVYHLTVNNINHVEDIQDVVELYLMKNSYYKTAKAYITYRYKRSLVRNANITDVVCEKFKKLVDGQDEESNKENSNKDTRLLSTMRDYIAGFTCKEYAEKYLIPEKLMQAHKDGLIHIHDMDYSPAMNYNNCGLINLEDMLQNGTVISGTMIEKPKSFRTACTIVTQIITLVSSSQYGGNTINLAHLVPFVDISRKKIRKQVEDELKDINTTDSFINEIVDKRLRDEIKDGIQTIQYQLITMSTTNGQAPFTSMFMYLNDVEDGQPRKDMALLIEEVLKQRIQGVKNENGYPITTAFPKLLYTLDENNISENSEYYYLTKLAAECSSKRLVPDYISAKKMRDLKDGNVFGCMGALAGHEHLYIKINDDTPIDISIRELFDLCKENKIVGRPAQVYYNKKDLYILTDENWRNTQVVSNDSIKSSEGVYKITYLPEDISYIGSSKNIQQRIRNHKKCIKHKGGLDTGLNFENTNIDDYKFEILEYTENYKEAEKKYVSSIPNVNFKEIINKYYKNVGLTKNQGYDDRPDIKMDSSIPQDIINLEQLDIKVLDVGNNWVKVNKIFKNDKFNTPLMMHITYQENNKVYTLCCTEDHPLWTGNKFIEACRLKVGDTIYRADGIGLLIVQIKWYNDRIDSYDISTETGSFIGSDIIMHNCRSFLQPYYDEDNKPKFWGRFNQGVVTVNLVDVALSSGKDIDKFWTILDERLQMCYDALMIRHNRLLGTKSDVAPILWQYGAYARLKPGETIDKLLFNDYSSISLGYAGLYECIKYMTDQSQLEQDGHNLGIEIMETLNNYCKKWKSETNIGFSVYGTPIESTTYKFAKCLQKRFGKVKDITDKNYITNSYHITPSQKIDAFSKLKIESEFQELSLGGNISYIEVPNMQKNINALLEVIKFIYDTNMYAEINTMTSYCKECGCTDIQMGDDLKFHCPQCGNTDFNKMNIALRVCGYISTNPFNDGRAEDIHDRVKHLGYE